MNRRRPLAQFFTPLPVARFMAHLAAPSATARRFLDPGAGTGTLACALIERVPVETGGIHLDAYEIDPILAKLCTTALAYAGRWLQRKGIRFSFTVHNRDFVLAHGESVSPNLFSRHETQYDVAIENPPYFKLARTDARALAASSVIHGQPNIYALFMSVSAGLLADAGTIVTITPRSFATGDYFREFRRYFFDVVTPEAIHLFNSRKSAFRDAAVLQENIILRAKKLAPGPHSTVAISASDGIDDIVDRASRKVSLSAIIDKRSRDLLFQVPTHETDDTVAAFVRSWPHTLLRLGYQVSTGPVVAFRARRFLVSNPRPIDSVAPLLWLNNVRPMVIEWPIETTAKIQYLRDVISSRKLLLPNRTCVLLRRFSAKEERRRLTAAPLLKGQLPGPRVGLENHLNYIFRPHGQMAEVEAVGLAALLNNAVFDRYFRISSGSTQANAMEIRALPMPPRKLLIAIGEEITRSSLTGTQIDDAVAEVLRFPRELIRLVGADG